MTSGLALLWGYKLHKKYLIVIFDFDFHSTSIESSKQFVITKWWIIL